MSKLLLHICCGVCAGPIVQKYKDSGFEVTGYFYNPNIHPHQEFLKRLEAVESLSRQENLPIYYERAYGLDEFIKAVEPHAQSHNKKRCAQCYELRLKRTAQYARQNGFELFATTLSISPFQDQSLIKEIGQKEAISAGIGFNYELMTSLYQESKKLAKDHNLYRQQYCGCIFSEYERYAKK
ncbi:MAG: epoxyqueuosine reductase QueH [Candidatus Brocadiia bacterium]